MALNTEALARHLAWRDVNDHIRGGSWYGWPDDDNPEEMEESFNISLPFARKKAEEYVRILTEPTNAENL